MCEVGQHSPCMHNRICSRDYLVLQQATFLRFLGLFIQQDVVHILMKEANAMESSEV